MACIISLNPHRDEKGSPPPSLLSPKLVRRLTFAQSVNPSKAAKPPDAIISIKDSPMIPIARGVPPGPAKP